MKKFLRWSLMGMFCSLSMLANPVFAGDLEILMEKLVEKGVFSPVEAQIIIDETAADVAKDMSQGKSYSAPSWVQNIKLKGDLRIRFQKEKRTNNDEARKRGRIRFRLGAEAKVVKDVKVGFGFTSGGSDPRSTNQTFDSTFQTGDLRLDYAYAEWQATKKLAVIGGKFQRKKYLWQPTDMLWDGDITPEGASFLWKDNNPLFDNSDYWLAGGVWILDENGLADFPDAYMKYLQAGFKAKKDKFDFTSALTFYDPQGVNGKSSRLDNSTSTNTFGTRYNSSYRSIDIGADAGAKKLFGGLPFNIDDRMAIFGHFVRNLDDGRITEDITGFSFGFKLGHVKIKEKGSWQLKYIKTKLGKDAWLDTFPDSDRFDGKTGIAGHEVTLQYALKKNVIFGIDWYKTWSDTDTNNHEQKIQVDVLLKF